MIIVPLPKRTIDLGNRAATPKNAAVTGIALAFLSWLVLLFAGFGGENAACPDGDAAWVDPLAVACAVTATLGMGRRSGRTVRAPERHPANGCSARQGYT